MDIKHTRSWVVVPLSPPLSERGVGELLSFVASNVVGVFK